MRANKESVGISRIAMCLFAVSWLIALNGCGDGKIKRYPVTGTVMVDGKPAEGALVFFCPVDPKPELENLRPFGTTDATGTFELTTIEENDGAPAGQYKVLAKWPQPMPAADDGRDGRGTPLGPDRLKNKYYNLGSTPLAATIEEQSNELPPFELSAK
jgi:hypothetical protein